MEVSRLRSGRLSGKKTTQLTASMKKMIKHRRVRVSQKDRMLKNSRAWRRLTRKESGADPREQSHQVEKEN